MTEWPSRTFQSGSRRRESQPVAVRWGQEDTRRMTATRWAVLVAAAIVLAAAADIDAAPTRPGAPADEGTRATRQRFLEMFARAYFGIEFRGVQQRLYLRLFDSSVSDVTREGEHSFRPPAARHETGWRAPSALQMHGTPVWLPLAEEQYGSPC